MHAPEIRALARSDEADATTVLGRAFRDNPTYAAALPRPTPEARLAPVTRVLGGFVSAALRHHEATGVWVDGRLAGAMLVQAPGQYPTHLAAKTRQAVGVARTGPAAIVRFLLIDHYIARAHVKEPHHYLFILGIDPDMQGRGLGKALLGALAAQADARGLPSYLETDKETSVRLYASAGYEVLTEGVVPGVAFRMWTMRRPALR